MKLHRIPLALTVALLLCTAVVSHAQEVIYSKYDKFDFRTGEFSVVGKVGARTYVYRGSSEGYYLDAYDTEMKRLATVILDFIPRRSFGTKFITYPGKIIVFYQVTESSKVIQYGAVLDETGRLMKRPRQIDEVKSSFLGGRSGLYSYAVSQNKQYIAVYGAGTKNTELNARVLLLDTGLNKLYTKQTSFSADNNISFGEGVINDAGEFFLPAYTPYGSRQYADRIWLLALQQESKNFEPVELPMNGLFAAGTYMEMANAGNRIYLGGFYTDKKNGNYEGVIYTYYDIAEKAFTEFKTIAFSERMRIATGERSKKRAFNDFQVRQLIVRNDGGFVLIAEDFFITTRSGYNNGFGYYSWYYPAMSASVREYNYGDILAISCKATGEPEWAEFVRKVQYSQEDGGLFSSYALINTGGTIGFLYNDFNMSRSKVQLATIDGEGKIIQAAMSNNKSDEPDWLPKSGKQVSAKEFVVPCLRRNQICFAKVVF